MAQFLNHVMQNDILKPIAPKDEDLLETLNITSLEILLWVDWSLSPWYLMFWLYAWKKKILLTVLQSWDCGVYIQWGVYKNHLTKCKISLLVFCCGWVIYKCGIEEGFSF